MDQLIWENFRSNTEHPMYSTAILSHILFLNVSHLYSWANEIWKYYSDSVYREYGIVERGFYGWN